jgi:hypothetical protein
MYQRMPYRNLLPYEVRIFGIVFDICLYVVTWFSDYRRGLDWMIGLTDSFFVQSLLIASHTPAIADLHTFQFTVTHAPEFSFFSSRVLVTELKRVSL